MNSLSERQFEFTGSLKAWLDRNPTAQFLPASFYREYDQLERYTDQIDQSRVGESVFNKQFFVNEVQESFTRRADRMQIRQQLSKYLEGVYQYTGLIEYQKRADDLESARHTGAIGLTEDNRHIVAWDKKVNCVRLCPDDAREEAKRLNRKYGNEIFKLLSQSSGLRLFYCVYTAPNEDAGRLLEGKRSIYKDFAGLHRTKWGKEHIKGTFSTQEDPLSKHDDWNVHINALHLVSGDFDYRELRRLWGRNVEIRQVKGTIEEISKSLMEIIKYAAKHIGEKSEDGNHTVAPGMTSWPYERFHEWYMAGKGFRRTRSYGLLFRIKKPAPEYDIDSVQWVGSANWDSTAYQVHFKQGLGVDLIQADKSAFLRSSSAVPGRVGCDHPPDYGQIVN